jgi:hypothetical protein
MLAFAASSLIMLAFLAGLLVNHSCCTIALRLSCFELIGLVMRSKGTDEFVWLSELCIMYSPIIAWDRFTSLFNCRICYLCRIYGYLMLCFHSS